jgi:prepilin-type N-terminal cleavage/methylation domain-containing protein/prepilin-type processing-associated H-X9-DG protein
VIFEIAVKEDMSMGGQRKAAVVRSPKLLRAFTLVELLVVIGIIALLISILLPALNKARQSANSLACQANLHSIGQAISMYVADSKGILPYGWWNGTWNPQGTTNGSTLDTSHGNDWVSLLLNELNGKLGGSMNDVATNGSIISRTRQMFMCPDAPGQGVNGTSFSSICHYACHPRLMPVLDGWLSKDSANPNAFIQPYKIGRIRRSAEIGLIFDGSLINIGTDTWGPYATYSVAVYLDRNRWGPAGSPTPTTYLTDNYSLGPTLLPDTSVDMRSTSNFGTGQNQDVSGNANNIRFRHMKDTTCNALMVDGHVQSFHLNIKYLKTFVQSDVDRATDLLRRNINVPPP